MHMLFFSEFVDEDLAAMYLSDKKAGKLRSLNDHDDLEVLLESFSKQVEEIVNETETISVSMAACDLGLLPLKCIPH
jgi:Magnesium transporter MRS2-like